MAERDDWRIGYLCIEPVLDDYLTQCAVCQGPERGYDPWMRRLPVLLLVLALPAGLLGYTLAVQVLAGLPLPAQAQDVILLFVPLLIGGLCMLPFIVPFFDGMAKRDLAAHQRSQEASGRDQDEGPGEDEGIKERE